MPAATTRAAARRMTSPSLARTSEDAPVPTTTAPSSETLEASVRAASGGAEPSELALIGALFSDTLALESLAQRHGLSLRALIAWAERRDISALRRSMRELADDRADLIASRARTAAAHRLERLTSEAKSEETARKACVDLLRLRPGPAASTPAFGDEPPADPDAELGDEELFARLDRLAEQTHAPREPDDSVPSGAD